MTEDEYRDSKAGLISTVRVVIIVALAFGLFYTLVWPWLETFLFTV